MDPRRAEHFLSVYPISVARIHRLRRGCLAERARARDVRGESHLATDDDDNDDDDGERNTAAKHICHHPHSSTIGHHLRQLIGTRHSRDRGSASRRSALPLAHPQPLSSTVSLLSTPSSWLSLRAALETHRRLDATLILLDRSTECRRVADQVHPRSPSESKGEVSCCSALLERSVASGIAAKSSDTIGLGADCCGAGPPWNVLSPSGAAVAVITK